MKNLSVLKKYYIIATILIFVEIVNFFSLVNLKETIELISQESSILQDKLTKIQGIILLNFLSEMLLFILVIQLIYILTHYFVKPISNLLKNHSPNLEEFSKDLQNIIAGNNQIAESLKQSQERYSLAIEGSSSGVWDYNIKENNMFVSERFKEILGFKNDENFNPTFQIFQQLMHPDDYDMSRESLRNHLNNKEKYDVECRLKHKNGEYIYVQLRGQAMWSSETNDEGFEVATRIAGSMSIIQQRKLAEQKLLEKQEFLSLAFSATQDGIWHWNVADGDVWFSKRWKEMLGYQENEIQNNFESWEKLIHPEDAPTIFEKIKEFKEGTIKEFADIHRYISKKGEIVYILSKAVRKLNQNGAVVSIVGSHMDITRMQQVIDEAEAANQAKSEFLANMSHEIRTPMNGIIGMSDLVLKTELKPKQRYYADLIKKSANNLMEIINGILDFSKIEAGKLELEEVQFDMREAVEEVIDLLSIRAFDKNIQIFLQYDSNTANIVYGDLVRVKQIINNLVGNAIKFTSQGYILVSVKAGRKEKGKTIFEFGVEDTGVGIAENKRKSIFQKFSQEDSSTTRKFGGTGLGLAISKQLIEAMGGEIGVVSKVGFGSKFWFHIKLKAEAVELKEEFKEMQGTKILVIDNPTPNNVLIADILKPYDVQVQTVDEANVIKILKRANAEKQPFDMVILDYFSPNGVAEDLIKEIRSHSEMQNVKIVLLIAKNNKGNLSFYSKLGCQAYLIKPLQHVQFLQCLNAVRKAEIDPTGESKIVTKYIINSFASQNQEATQFLNSRILVAEDNFVNQEVISAIFNNLSCQISVASNGQEACEAVEKEDFDLIFMDCQMPVMDGFQAAEKISKMKKSIPIVALTANVLQEDKDKCLASGMCDFATKPVNEEQIIAIMKKWIIGKEETPQIQIATKQEPIKDGPINFQTLEHLEKIVKSKFKFLIEQYIKDTEINCNNISQMLKNKEKWDDESFATFKRSAHSSKSASGQVGALELSKIFAEIEMKAGKKDYADLDALAAKMESEFHDVKEVLTSYVGGK